MSATSTAAALGDTGPAVPEQQHRRSGLPVRAAELLAGLVLLMALNYLAGAAGFWSADEAVSHQQVELLADGSWTLQPPEPTIDPRGRWHPLSPISLGEGVAAPYVKHPLFPSLVRVGDLLGGRIGRYLIPAIGSVLASLLIAVGADRRLAGSGRLSYWLVLGGTPLLFHGTTMWAHSLGVATAAGAFLVVQRLLDVRRSHSGRVGGPRTDLVWPAALAFTAAAGVLLRSEAAIFFVLLGCCLGLFGLLGRRKDLMAAGLVALVVAVAAFQVEAGIRSAILGPAGDVGLDVPPEPLLDLGVRGSLLWTWLVGSRPDLGLGRLIGAILLAMAALSARRDSSLSLSPNLGLIGGMLYLPALLAGATMAVGPAAPAVLVGLLLIERADPLVRFTALLSALYFAAVVATSYANGGGGDWGGRYLALLLAPLAIIALPEIQRLRQPSISDDEQRSNALRPLLIGALVASLAIGVSMSLDVVTTRRATGDLAARLAAEIETETDPTDLVVATDGRIGRLLGDTEVDARLLQVTGSEMPELVDRLEPGSELLILDHLQPFDIPAGWTVLNQSEFLVRVRLPQP